nr:Fic family protein [Bifidobacterium sp. DSM 109959]
MAFGGRFKDTDNVIVERTSDGTQSVRFTPPPAIITPEPMQQACAAYRDVTEHSRVDPLLATAMFVFDVTCIHPFNDGNGRMSRPLTLLLLSRSGFEVGKYINIEHIIEQTKDAYYDALAASTQGWNDDANDYAPFVTYLLGVILTAYQDFDERISAVMTGTTTAANGRVATKESRIAALFERSLAPMAKADAMAQLPDISMSTVERTLKHLLDAGVIVKIGAGRATRYVARRDA